jgi:DNA-directed RNA polymerase subunit E'/Rpb7
MTSTQSFWDKIAVIPIINMEKDEDRRQYMMAELARVGAPAEKITFVRGLYGLELVHKAIRTIDAGMPKSFDAFREYWNTLEESKHKELMKSIVKISIPLKPYIPFIQKLKDLKIFDSETFHVKFPEDNLKNLSISLSINTDIWGDAFTHGQIGHAASYKVIMRILASLKRDSRALLLEDDVKLRFDIGNITDDITRVFAHTESNNRATIYYFGMSKRHLDFGGNVEDLGGGVGRPVGVQRENKFKGLITGTHAILYNRHTSTTVYKAMSVLRKPTDHIVSDLVNPIPSVADTNKPLNALTTMKLYIEPLDAISSTIGYGVRNINTQTGTVVDAVVATDVEAEEVPELPEDTPIIDKADNLHFITGNILTPEKCEYNYIVAHQTNAEGKLHHGIRHLFNYFPEAGIDTNQTIGEAHLYKVQTPDSTAKCIEYIINLNAQVKTGRPAKTGKLDTLTDRIVYFTKALNHAIILLKNNNVRHNVIAFPYLIGCDFNGVDIGEQMSMWKRYRQVINGIAEENPEYDFVIVQPTGTKTKPFILRFNDGETYMPKFKPVAVRATEPVATGLADEPDKSVSSLMIDDELPVQTYKHHKQTRFASNVAEQKGIIETIAMDEDDVFNKVLDEIRGKNLFDPEIYIEDDVMDTEIRTDIYIKSVLIRKVVLDLNNVGRNLVAVLRTMLNRTYTGKCIAEGYVRTGSVEIIKYTSGKVILGAKVEFNVLFTCLICNPVAGMTFMARVIATSKAGIVAQYTDGKNKASIARPIIAFVARDHMYLNDRFTKHIKVGSNVKINVLKTHFELGDPNVYVMGIIDDFEEIKKQETMRETREARRLTVAENRTLADVRTTIAPDERSPRKYAAVWLLMKNKEYLAGILASVYSWKLSGSKAETVVMITRDLSVIPEVMTALRLVVDKVVEIDYIKVKSTLRKGIMDKYGTWFSEGYTKWNCLMLEEYEKVLLMDADTIIFNCMDELFELNAPAGTFSSPWVKPYSEDRNAGPNVYTGHDKHGDLIPLENIEYGKTANFLIGTTVLLEPNREVYARFIMWLYGNAATNENGFGLTQCGSMLDEQAITLFYHSHKIQWTYIDHRYNAIPWHPNWNYRVLKSTELRNLAASSPLPEDKRLYIFHYFDRKPWSSQMPRGKHEDLEPWWEIVQRLVADYPSLKYIFRNDINNFKMTYECPICSQIGYDDKNHTIFEIKEEDGRVQMTNHIRCPNLQIVNAQCPRIGEESGGVKLETVKKPDETWDE